ncbi:SPOSA6832_03975 [Sporobolomyces salmonicolor]|uniref:SPOSA6832_03975-mRNA-1:cds n=1 Tax=Sporidiobolus salmonicolor TaxID=5005 RepID=A0A0D6EQG4_SPOSA|nr:SPOSA6832_03975 [Sporobolomyces salmonicolor]
MNQCPPSEPVPASGSPFPAGHPAPASPLTGAISSTKSSPSTALPHHAEPLEEEWLLKSIAWPPLPPPPSNSHPDSYDAGQSSKGFETDERLRVKIIQQNRNGPCSLIALCNILILRNDIHIAPGRDRVTYSFLSNLLADYFLRVTTTTPSSEAPPSPTSPTTTQLSLEAALSILPSTQSGLNLNPQFSRINGFVSTPSSGAGELALFSLAKIPLLHGWLADPADQETYEALREAGDYDRALEMVVEGSEIAGGRLELREDEMSDEELMKEAERRSSWTPLQEQKVRKAHLINTFLNSTSTQLTYPGLFTLSSTPSLLPPSGLAALFRNSHLSVLYRRPSSPSSTFNTAASHGGPELFTLVTDSSFAGEEEVVWESLEDTDGSGSDLALAHRLQAEENDRAAYAYERERERHRHAQAQQELDDDSDDASSLDDAPRGARAPPPTPYASRTTTTTAKAEAREEGQGGKAASGAATGARRTSKGGKPKAEKDKCVVM